MHTNTCPHTHGCMQTHAHTSTYKSSFWEGFWWLIKKLIDYFYSSFRFIGKLNRKYREFPHANSHTQFPFFSTSCTSVVHLLQLISQQWYIINQIPLSTLEFTLCVVSSMGFDKYIMASIYHQSAIQNSFTALKFPCAPPIHSTHPLPRLLALRLLLISLFQTS